MFVVETFLREHKGSVTVLTGVRVVVEPSHEDDAVDGHAPLLPDHLFGLFPEGARRNASLASSLGLDELLGLGE